MRTNEVRFIMPLYAAVSCKVATRLFHILAVFTGSARGADG